MLFACSTLTLTLGPGPLLFSPSALQIRLGLLAPRPTSAKFIAYNPSSTSSASFLLPELDGTERNMTPLLFQERRHTVQLIVSVQILIMNYSCSRKMIYIFWILRGLFWQQQPKKSRKTKCMQESGVVQSCFRMRIRLTKATKKCVAVAQFSSTRIGSDKQNTAWFVVYRYSLNPVFCWEIILVDV